MLIKKKKKSSTKVSRSHMNTLLKYMIKIIHFALKKRSRMQTG